MEPLDIVDLHDELVGTADRSEVHRKGLLHRGIIVLVFDPNGKLFVQRRARFKDLFPGFYEGSVSGHVRSGESYHDAAIRELHEELGICASPHHVRELFTFGFHSDEERQLIKLYVLKDYHGDIIIDGDEVEQGTFFDLGKLANEIAKKPFHPASLHALKLFLEFDGTTRDYLPVKRTTK